MHGTLASTIEGIPLKSKLSPRSGRDKNAWERVVSSRIVEQEPGRITIPWRNSIHKYAKFRTTQRRGAARGVALLKRPFATATSSLAGRSFRFAIDCNIAACTRARHPSLGPAYLRCFSRCYSLEWEARKRAFKRFMEKNIGLPPITLSFLSLSRLPAYTSAMTYGESHDRKWEQKDKERSLRARRYTALRDFSWSRDTPRRDTKANASNVVWWLRRGLVGVRNTL